MTLTKDVLDPLEVVIESITMHMTYATVQVRFQTSKPVSFNVPADYAATLVPKIGQKVVINFDSPTTIPDPETSDEEAGNG